MVLYWFFLIGWVFFCILVLFSLTGIVPLKQSYPQLSAVYHCRYETWPYLAPDDATPCPHTPFLYYPYTYAYSFQSLSWVQRHHAAIYGWLLTARPTPQVFNDVLLSDVRYCQFKIVVFTHSDSNCTISINNCRMSLTVVTRDILNSAVDLTHLNCHERQISDLILVCNQLCTYLWFFSLFCYCCGWNRRVCIALELYIIEETAHKR